MSEDIQNENGRNRDGYESRHEGNENFGRPRFNNGTGRPRFSRPEHPIAGSSYNSNRGEGGYRPRHNDEGGYQPRQQRSEGGYQSDRREGGYRPRFNRGEGGYQPRENRWGNNRYNNERNEGYRPRTEGGEYRQGQNNYRQGQGGYRPRYNNEGGYNQEGGYRQEGFRQNDRNQGGYRPRFQAQGGYNNRPQFKRAGYDPHAKYSQKKRLEYKEENYDPAVPVRLNKFLANAGVCSRRDADRYIEAGVVTVNGQVVTELGTKVLRTDEIRFHDNPVKIEKKVYVLLNKPKGYVTTSEDPQNRKTVMDLVKNICPERIYPVGRLDRNTTGVLLLTNDGDMASKLTHPKFLKKKIYHVTTDQNVTAADLHKIAEGITLDDGEIKADAVEYASETDKKQIGIEIHSGRNRIVRRIFESLGYHVVKLDRVYFAGLTKKNVKRGDWRFLTEKEVSMLRMGAFE